MAFFIYCIGGGDDGTSWRRPNERARERLPTWVLGRCLRCGVAAFDGYVLLRRWDHNNIIIRKYYYYCCLFYYLCRMYIYINICYIVIVVITLRRFSPFAFVVRPTDNRHRRRNRARCVRVYITARYRCRHAQSPAIRLSREVDDDDDGDRHSTALADRIPDAKHCAQGFYFLFYR